MRQSAVSGKPSCLAKHRIVIPVFTRASLIAVTIIHLTVWMLEQVFDKVSPLPIYYSSIYQEFYPYIMENTDWIYQRASFADKEGRLRTYLDRTGDIWVPPEANLRERIPSSSAKRDMLMDFPFDRPKVMVLPIEEVSKHWQTSDKRIYYPTQLPGTVMNDPDNQGNPDYNSIWFAPLRAGWIKKMSTEDLLDDFLSLSTGKPEKVKAFALKWGPLWYCQTHRTCIWGVFSSHHLDEDGRCYWLASEPIAAFSREAKRLKAALTIAGGLNADPPRIAPDEIWEDLIWEDNLENYIDGPPRLEVQIQGRYVPVTTPDEEEVTRQEVTVLAQRVYLSLKINEFLADLGGPGLRIDWSTSPRAKLSLHTGWGFLSAAWVQAIQLITEVRNLYTCDGCNRSYFRAKKRPAPGKSNYCDECGNRAAKKNWARRNSRYQRL
jgi:hypothetical protein